MQKRLLWIDSTPIATEIYRIILRINSHYVEELHYGFQIDSQLDRKYDYIVLNPWFVYGSRNSETPVILISGAIIPNGSLDDLVAGREDKLIRLVDLTVTTPRNFLKLF